VPRLLVLALTFAKIGVMTFGGGYAMLPLLVREVVEKRAWLTPDEFADYVAVAQATPGIIAVNIATFVGHKQAKTVGAICATLGVVAPSIVIICVIASVLREYSGVAAVAHAFAGVRVAVVGLIAKTVVTLWKSSVKTTVAAAVFAVTLIISVAFGVTPILIAVATAIFGVVFGRLRGKV